MEHLLAWGRDAALLAILASLPALVIAGISFMWRRRSASDQQAALAGALDALMLVTIIGVLVVGLRPGMGVDPEWQQWILLPFRDIVRALDGSTLALQLAIANLLGNVLLYVPFGVALALRFAKLGPLRALFIASALSLLVEIGQAVEANGRTSDVTDLIANSMGGLIGWWIGFAIASALHKGRPFARSVSS